MVPCQDFKSCLTFYKFAVDKFEGKSFLQEGSVHKQYEYLPCHSFTVLIS